MGVSPPFRLCQITPPQCLMPRSLPDSHGMLPIALSAVGRPGVIASGLILVYVKTSELAEDGGLEAQGGGGTCPNLPHVKPEFRAPNPPAQCSLQLSTRFTDRIAFLSYPVLAK